jgi:hypothetical protein
LVIALIAEDRRHNGSLPLTLAITIGTIVWAIVRLASPPGGTYQMQIRHAQRAHRGLRKLQRGA